MRLRRLAAAVLAVAATLAPAPGHAGLDDATLAKIGLARFLLDHADRPLRIDEPCPALSQAAAAAHVGALGLVPSTRPYGPAIVWDDIGGAGIVSLRCGNDLSLGGDPSGSVGVAVDVTMLDGQASFDRYAVDLDGNDVVVDRVSVPPIGDSRLASRCTDGGTRCTAALWIDDLVITARLRGLSGDTGDTLARRFAIAIAPDIVADLAASATAAIDG